VIEIKNSLIKEMTKCNNKSKGNKHEIVDVPVSELEKSIDLLAKNPNVQIQSLNKNDPLYKAFETVKLSVSLLYDTKQFVIIQDILSKYKSPSQISPGTIGAFLFGCQQDNYGDLKERFCSILCIGSIPPSKTKYPMMCCSSQIWSHDNTKLVKVSDAKNGTTKAIIYPDFPFLGFTQKELNELKTSGIKKVTLMDTTNNKHVITLDSVDVDKLPKKDSNGPVGINMGQGTGSARDVIITSGSLIWIVLLIIAIIALIAWLWIKSSKDSTKQYI
jgi:hypothetical protein